ncbi:MAG TPA: type II toxin-antitoxin system PemK/MazF family toxin [Geminicoccaceae bacterium]|nr:type II toxin-antitoxin system PemK/MazF family toxin [Geminicoccaceae bacterium]
MTHGDIFTVSGGSDYAGKPRPAVVIQSDSFHTTASVAMCLVTSEDIGAILFRVPLEPTPHNTLSRLSWIKVDNVVTMPRNKVGRSIGRLTSEQLRAVDAALALFLGRGGE